MSDQLTRIERKIDRFMVNRAIHRAFILVVLGALACWNLWCQRESQDARREMLELLTAQRLAFTDVLMRYKEDPKDQARFDKTMEDLTDYYRRKLNGTRN